MRSAPTRLRGRRLLRLGRRARVRGREVAAEVQPLAERVGVRPRRRRRGRGVGMLVLLLVLSVAAFYLWWKRREAEHARLMAESR